MAFDKYPYTNFHELNLEWFMKEFDKIFRQWDELYTTLTEWKDTTTTELAEWREDVMSDIVLWETELSEGLAIWKADTEQDISDWETGVLSDLADWKDDFETLFDTTFENLSQIKTDAEAARDAAAASATAAAASAASISGSASQIALNTSNIANLQKITEDHVTRAPAGYTQIEYAESDWEQTCTLGFKANPDTRMIIQFAVSDDLDNMTVNGTIFGGRYTTASRAYSFQYSTSKMFRMNYVNTWYDIAPADNNIHILDADKNKFYFDGILRNQAPEAASTFESYHNIQLFGVRDRDGYFYGKTRIYGCKVFDGDTLIRDCIPVIRNSDNAVGMYDLVAQEFHYAYNPDESLTVNFIAGPITSINALYLSLYDIDRHLLNIDAELLKLPEVPREYTFTEADRVSDKVRNVQTGRTLTFAAISDLHYKADETDGVIKNALEDMRDTIKNIAGQTNIDFYTCLGDIIWRLSSDGNFDLGKEEIIGATKIINDTFQNNKQLRIIGNHDPNAEGMTGFFTAHQLNAYMGIYSNLLSNRRLVSYPGSTTDVSYQGIGYVDFEAQKVRLIALDTSVYAQGEANQPEQHATQYRFGTQQAYWLCYALDLTADKGTDASNWQVVIMSHVAGDAAGHGDDIGRYVTSVLRSYINGTTWTLSTYSFNFSGKNAAQLALYINGHAHKYYFGNEKAVNQNNQTLEILPMACLYVPNALPARDEASIDGITYTKTANSAESTAFQIITLDPVNKIVYAHHAGAGIDIILHYNPSSNTALSTSIASPSWNSTNTAIATVSNGTVIPVANGYATIWAKSVADNTIEAWNFLSQI